MMITRTLPTYFGKGFGWADREFARLQNDMNRLFENTLGRGVYSPVRSVFPPVNLYENNENIYLTAELPGMEAKDVEINVEADSILIKGERKIKSEGGDIAYHRRERESGSFSKKISLKTRIATDKVSAEMNNGVLKITLPKAEEAKPKKIDVKVN